MSISAMIDIGIVLIVLVSAGVSFFRGFVREVLTIFGVIGGGFAAYLFGDKASPVIRGWLGVGEKPAEGEHVKKLFDLIPYTIVADVCAYAGIFLAVFLILQLISYFMSASIKAIGLGPVDRALGVAFGIARAFLFLGIIYLVIGGLIPEDNKREILGKSKTIVYVEAVSDWMKGFMPADGGEKAKEKTEDFAKDKLEDLKGASQDAAGKLGDKAQELKDKVDEKVPAYSPEERQNLNKLIENQNDTPLTPPTPQPTPSSPERPSSNE